MSKSKIKSVLICFFNSQGIVHKEFVPPRQGFNQHFFWEVVERLFKRVVHPRPNINCITTMRHVTQQSVNRFWPVRTFLWLLSLLIRPIWVLVTFLLPEIGKTPWGMSVMGPWTTFKRLELTSWRLFQYPSSSTALMSGRNVSSAELPKVITTKGTMFNCNVLI